MKLIFTIVLIILAVALFFVYTDPTYENIKVLKAEEKRFDDALEKSEELIALRDSLLQTYNGFKTEDLARLKKLLPDNIDNVRLILDLDGIARAQGISIRNVDVNQVTNEDPGAQLGKVELSFTLVAPYERFQAFIEDLEDSLRIVDIVNITFTESGAQTVYEVRLNTYWLL